ncbi:hypothetical protein HY604_03425 [Candidatus Peregrinibacteria bacterium]|nr:hypothetical protein [Candidatus Peregrinibacteria bacterium]
MSAESRPESATISHVPESDSAVLTVESIRALIKTDILRRFAAIGADTVAVDTPSLAQEDLADLASIEYVADIGAGANPWFREAGTITINGEATTCEPQKYYGRQIFAYDLEAETENPYPVYINDDFTEIEPGDFFTAGPVFPGTRILQVAGDAQTEISLIKEFDRTEIEGKDGMLRITEIETVTPIEITRIVASSIRIVTGFKLEEYTEPTDPIGFYSNEPLFSPPPHIQKARGDLAKASLLHSAQA